MRRSADPPLRWVGGLQGAPEELKPSARVCLGSIVPPMESIRNRKIKRRDPVRTGPRPEIQTGSVAIATAAAAVSTTTAPPPPAAAGALFPRLGHVDCEGAAAQLRAIQRADGFLRLLGGVHGDEAKTAGTAGGPVHHQVGFHDRAVRGKRVLQVVFGGVEGKIPDK